jgi:hypothetical protein
MKEEEICVSYDNKILLETDSIFHVRNPILTLVFILGDKHILHLAAVILS